MQKLFIKMRNFFPLSYLVFCLLCSTMSLWGSDIPLIPIQSPMLHEKANKLAEWKKKASLASKLPYFSGQSQRVAIEQYLLNAKIFMLNTAIKGVFYPLNMLELQLDIFENNVFEFTKKYCSKDLKTDLDWGSLTRQIFLYYKKQRPFSRWDDSWSKGNLPLDIQQKLYTARITKSMDAIKSLCVGEKSSVESVAKFYLQDEVVAMNFIQHMANTENKKFYCESTIFCREISHDDFLQRLPKSMLDLEFQQEMINLWKSSIEEYSPNWDLIKTHYSSLSKLSTEQARIHLRDELLGVSDFFATTQLMTKNSANVLDDPILKSIKPFIDQLVTNEVVKMSQKVSWEDPMEIIIEKNSDLPNALAIDIKAVKGGFDKMIDKLDKFKISDQIVFDRGFLEWFLRATLNIRYYNEQLYWSNVEAIQHHLNSRFQYYISERKLILPYLGYEKNMSMLLTKWFLDHRNDIADKVTANPDQKVFPLIINHYLGLSALETRIGGE
jgi:hypothetical protein